MGVWIQQLGIVLRKDLIIARRNYRSTLISILVPVIFVLFLYVLQVAFDHNERLSDIVHPVRTSSVTPIAAIPKCFIGRSPAAPTCITIAYAPKIDPVVNHIMDAIMTENGLVDSDLMGFDTSADLDRYLFEHPNTTQAAYNFFLVKEGSRVVGARYAVQYNMTTTTFRGKNYDPVYNVLLPMQKAADIGIMKTLLADRPALSVDYDFIGFTHPETLPLDVAAQYGPSFFFGALMFNFVIQLGRLVSEKELKLRSSMKQMGLRDSVYLTAGFVIVLGYNIISTFALSIAGLVFQIKFFLKNDFALYFLLFFLFGLSMTPLVLLLATFVSRARTATVLGFGVFLVGSIIQGFASIVFVESTAAYYRIPFSFLPFALLAKGMGDLSSFSNTQDSPGMRWSQRFDNDSFFPMTSSYYWLLIDTGAFLLLSMYLDQVIPDDNGVCQPAYYFLLPTYWLPALGRAPAVTQVDLDSQQYRDVDEDVLQEMKSATDAENDAPFKMINLQKTFVGYKFGFIRTPAKDFHAVRGVFLTIQPRTLFCLLGHNGAGKTTTINALTGLTRPSDGDAFIHGKSIRTSMSSVQKSMGVCPQYDILWAQMTAREHLHLFAGLKQVAPNHVAREILDRLQDVDLVDDADNLAGNFSGGMQRRLSVAIALIGNPDVVYLDEPTTGMDPVSRRKVWNLIERVKRDRITILTTHSMEEADVLADRIGIMHSGRFACIGNAIRLKQKFGSGYRITVRCHERQHAQVKDLFDRATLLSVEEGGQKFNVPLTTAHHLPALFALLETKRKELGIDDIQLNLSTLEEVFLKIGGLGETDDRVGEQDVSDPTHPLLRAETSHFKKHRVKYGIAAVLVIIIVVALTAAKKSSDSSVADLVIYPDDTRFDAIPDSVWAQLQSDTNVAKCSRGDAFSFFAKRGADTSSNVVIAFEGGGVCWDRSSCSSTLGAGSYRASISTDTTDPLKYGTVSGVLKQSEGNPFNGWTSVYVPLCTADGFLGQHISSYDAGLDVYHWGAPNVQRVLNWLRVSNLTPSKVLITGWGNGAIGAAFHAGTISDLFPAADIIVLTDSLIDFSSADNIGNGTIQGVPVSNLLGAAMDEWRLTAFQSWAVTNQSTFVPSVLSAAVPDRREWSSERVLLELSQRNSTSQHVAIARLNSVESKQNSDFLLSVLSQSDAVARWLQQSGISVAQLYGEMGAGSGGSGTGLSVILCPILKLLHNHAVVATAGGDYSGFLGAQSFSAVINGDALFNVTGLKTSSDTVVDLVDWIRAFLDQNPLQLDQVFGAACPSGAF